MRRQCIPTLTASALGLITFCMIVIGFWFIFPEARSQALGNATQDRVSAEELSAAIEAQRDTSAKLTRSASFDQRFHKLIDRAQKKGTVPVIVKVRAAFRPEDQIMNAAEALAQRGVIKEAQDQLLAGLRYVPCYDVPVRKSKDSLMSRHIVQARLCPFTLDNTRRQFCTPAKLDVEFLEDTARK